MAELNKMTHKTLTDWICKLDTAIRINEIYEDHQNVELFQKWKDDAVEELENRRFRRKQYLKRKGIK